MTVAWNLTKEQIKSIAVCVYEDIFSFIEEHSMEYVQYLKETQDYDNRYVTKTLFENMYSFIPDELRKGVSPTNYEFFYKRTSIKSIFTNISDTIW